MQKRKQKLGFCHSLARSERRLAFGGQAGPRPRPPTPAVCHQLCLPCGAQNIRWESFFEVREAFFDEPVSSVPELVWVSVLCDWDPASAACDPRSPSWWEARPSVHRAWASTLCVFLGWLPCI